MMTHDQNAALVALMDAIERAVFVGLFDVLGSVIDPDRIDEFVNAVDELRRTGKADHVADQDV